MTVLRAIAREREHVVTCALEVLVAERGLEDPQTPFAVLNNAEAALAFACREMVRAVDSLPMDRRPKGWDS